MINSPMRLTKIVKILNELTSPKEETEAARVCGPFPEKTIPLQVSPIGIIPKPRKPLYTCHCRKEPASSRAIAKELATLSYIKIQDLAGIKSAYRIALVHLDDRS